MRSQNLVKFLLLGMALQLVGVSLSGAEPEAGFEPLFNGKDLSGWEGNLDLWKVEEGMIVGDSAGIKQNEFLATKEQYENFELRLEFKLRMGEGNTGVQFRSMREPKSSAVIGYQADLGEKYWGCLYDEHRRNKVLEQAPAELDKVLKKDDWNTYVIRAEGNKITLLVNELKTVEYTEEDTAIAKTGIIALQVHSGPPLRIEFRNIRLKKL